jgi:hypothetical protein
MKSNARRTKEKPSKGSSISSHVNAFLLLESLDSPIHETVVKVFTAEVRV